LFIIDLVDFYFPILITQQKQRGINSLLETRVSTPIPLTSIPRRTKYGICLLVLEESPRKRGQVEIGFQGQQQVLSDNM
jgi:hypothetical protein